MGGTAKDAGFISAATVAAVSVCGVSETTASVLLGGGISTANFASVGFLGILTWIVGFMAS
jgi:hypothetical protein